MSWRMRNKGDRIWTWGYIIQAIPIHVRFGTRQIAAGYKLVIRTPYWVQHGKNVWYPVYISYTDLHKNQELYEWFRYNKRKPSLVYIDGKKRGQELYRNTECKEEDDPKYIWWIFIYQNSTIKPQKGLLPDSEKLKKAYLDEKKQCIVSI